MSPLYALVRLSLQKSLLGLLLIALALTACGPPPPTVEPVPEPPPPPLGWVPAEPAEAQALCRALYPVNQGLSSFMEMYPTVQACLERLESLGPGVPASDPRLSRETQVRVLKTLLEILPRLDAQPGLLAERFQWLKLTRPAGVTGYHLPAVEASLEKHPGYPFPLYSTPPDLKVLDLGNFHPRWEGQRLVYLILDGEAVPYPSREEILFHGALEGRSLELAWLKSLVDLQHLQTQGSGELVLPDGSRVLASYAGKNGRDFRGLGAVFLERGFLSGTHLTRQSMAEFLDNRPHLWRDVFAEDKSYVFFQLLDGPVKGAMGTPLQGRVSLAVDPSLAPLGLPLVLDAALPPLSRQAEPMKLPGLHLAQDTGGVIQGARIDYFWGSGQEAEERAMRTKVEGALYALTLKEF